MVVFIKLVKLERLTGRLVHGTGTRVSHDARCNYWSCASRRAVPIVITGTPRSRRHCSVPLEASKQGGPSFAFMYSARENWNRRCREGGVRLEPRGRLSHGGELVRIVLLVRKHSLASYRRAKNAGPRRLRRAGCSKWVAARAFSSGNNGKPPVRLGLFVKWRASIADDAR